MKLDTSKTYRERILRVLVHIQAHLDGPLNLEDLAKLSHFSPYHFHRVFRALVGESVHRYVRRLRLEGAALKLKQTDQSVLEIALGAGYETHEAFTRAFRAMFRVAPSAFRARHALIRSERGPALGLGGGFANDEESIMNVTIQRIEPLRIAFIRHVGPYDRVGETFQRLLAWAAPLGLLGPKVTILGVSHDDPSITPEDKLRFDAALVVDASVQADGEVGVGELAGGEHAVACHRGSYQELGKTYNALYGEWLPTSGREPADHPPFEIYLNDPETTEPDELLTDIYIPLKERAV
ncbi:GyrI-like domain-containing protein [Pendulispora albinea]|uniref:AraC family transcriptional regulator n=1 Tax=Pendulispora albinea TaxID=2741071 RepID=A0ABZ2MCI4_9BACT